MTSDPLPEVATPENLTHALRRSGSLGDGRVSEVVVESSRATILSKIIRLRLTYDGEALSSPSAVILKTGHPDRLGDANWDAGRQEVAFYNEVAAVKPGYHLLRCYEASWDAALGRGTSCWRTSPIRTSLQPRGHYRPQWNNAKASSAPVPAFMPIGGMSLVLVLQ